MRVILSLFVLLFAASCGQPAQPPAAPQPPPGVTVSNAWAAPTPGGVDVSAGYLTIINNTATADRLVAASSPRAREVQLHDMSMDAQMVMQMRQITSLDIPAGGMAMFSPGGKHIMFMGVFPPFAEGEQIPLTLTFEHAGVVDATLNVQRSAAP